MGTKAKMRARYNERKRLERLAQKRAERKKVVDARKKAVKEILYLCFIILGQIMCFLAAVSILLSAFSR